MSRGTTQEGAVQAQTGAAAGPQQSVGPPMPPGATQGRTTPTPSFAPAIVAPSVSSTVPTSLPTQALAGMPSAAPMHVPSQAPSSAPTTGTPSTLVPMTFSPTTLLPTLAPTAMPTTIPASATPSRPEHCTALTSGMGHAYSCCTDVHFECSALSIQQYPYVEPRDCMALCDSMHKAGCNAFELMSEHTETAGQTPVHGQCAFQRCGPSLGRTPVI